eukprot:TRINITY_DN2840_c7_g1_i1.p1 TRINITY_DN2840_c7_g1~~TRINITY_DN2840_c7_g1_i1.p1  ORF type:complete len:953 (+),score=81.73 TRINITY_DN2840_c7_g1_i1:115-2973(+)
MPGHDGERRGTQLGFLTGSLMPNDIDDRTEESISILKGIESPKPRDRRESRMFNSTDAHGRRRSSRRRSSLHPGKRLSLFEPPVMSLSASLPIKLNPVIPTEIAALWTMIDVHSKGYLNFEEVEYLLDDLGVVMDDWKETEFFHKVDTNHDGRVSLEEFSSTYLFFKESDKFLYAWSSVHLACNIAARQGITDTSIAVRSWHRYDQNNDECLDEKEVVLLLKDLNIEVTPARVAEFMHEMDTDKSGFIEFQEFVDLFSLDSAGNLYGPEPPQDPLNVILSEVRNVRAGIEFYTNNKLLTTEQREADNLKRVKEWYDQYYSGILLMYGQVNVLIPTFLIFINAISFERSYAWITPYLLLTDLVYFWFIYMKFKLPRVNHLGLLVTSKEDIRGQYLRSYEFVKDIIMMTPLDLIVGAVWAPGFLHPLFRLNKLIFLLDVNEIFYKCLARVLGPTWWRIANALYWWSMLAHCVACFFLLIAREEGDEGTKVMLTVQNFSTLPESHRYLQAYSYAVNTMAGLSRGTFPPGDLQQIFALITCLLGVWVYALMLAVVALALSAVTQKSKFAQYLDNAKDVLMSETQAQRLTENFVDEALTHHRHVFATTGLISLDENILEEVPLQLDVALSLVRGRDTICKVPIFQGACDDDEYVYALERSLQPRIVPPLYDIISEGEVGTEMYFISHGECEVLVKNTPVHLLKAGSFFGEIALMASCPRTATIRAKTFCNLLVLNKDSFSAVMSMFPEPMQLIENRARDRIRAMMQMEREERSKKIKTDLGRSALRLAVTATNRNPVDFYLEGSDSDESDDRAVRVKKNSDHEDEEEEEEFAWLASRPLGGNTDETPNTSSESLPVNPLRSRRRINRSDTGSSNALRRPLPHTMSFPEVRKVESFHTKTTGTSSPITSPPADKPPPPPPDPFKVCPSLPLPTASFPSPHSEKEVFFKSPESSFATSK